MQPIKLASTRSACSSRRDCLQAGSSNTKREERRSARAALFSIMNESIKSGEVTVADSRLIHLLQCW